MTKNKKPRTIDPMWLTKGIFIEVSLVPLLQQWSIATYIGPNFTKLKGKVSPQMRLIMAQYAMCHSLTVRN